MLRLLCGAPGPRATIDRTPKNVLIQPNVQVSVVVNYDLPEPVAYLHRAGRCTRFGRKGVAISFVTGDDAPALRGIETEYGVAISEMPMNVADFI